MKTLIAAAVLLALTTSSPAAPKGDWFLFFDVWACDVHDCNEGKPPDVTFVHKDAFATQKQCLAEIRHFVKISSKKPSKKEEEEKEGFLPYGVLTLDWVRTRAEKVLDTTIDDIKFHCARHR